MRARVRLLAAEGLGWQGQRWRLLTRSVEDHPHGLENPLPLPAAPRYQRAAAIGGQIRLCGLPAAWPDSPLTTEVLCSSP